MTSNLSMFGNDKNPFAGIEIALVQAKAKLGAMSGTQEAVTNLQDNDKKKRYLKGENKQLRD